MLCEGILQDCCKGTKILRVYNFNQIIKFLLSGHLEPLLEKDSKRSSKSKNTLLISLFCLLF
jgi:hypothetical protein